MRIAQINSVCGIGSTGRIAVDLSRIMNEQKIDNLIFYGYPPNDYVQGRQFGDKPSLRLHQLHTRLLGWHGFSSKHATMRLLRMLDEYQPDIIHLHNIHGFYLNSEMLFEYIKTKNIPVVWSLYDCWAFTGHCAHFDYIGCGRWKTGCRDCPQKKSYPISYFFDRSKEAYARKKKAFQGVKKLHVIAPSVWMSRMVGESFLQDYPVQLIPNGIDVETFKPTPGDFRNKHSLEKVKIVLGVAFSFSPNKGITYFNRLANDLDIAKYRVVLVGVDKKQYRHFSKDILLLPKTNSVQELAEAYTSADVFVNPTLEETQGLTNIEAMACGTPIITFNSGGSPECISNGRQGLVVERGLSDALYEAVITVLSKDKQYYSASCREHAIECYDKSKRYLEYINLYRRINRI